MVRSEVSTQMLSMSISSSSSSSNGSSSSRLGGDAVGLVAEVKERLLRETGESVPLLLLFVPFVGPLVICAKYHRGRTSTTGQRRTLRAAMREATSAAKEPLRLLPPLPFIELARETDREPD